MQTKRFLSLTLAFAAAALFAAAGCDSKPTTGEQKPGEKEHEHEHEHPTAGPSGGALVEWGEEEYHPEFLVDHDTQTATVYILGPDAEKKYPIDARQLTLTLTNLDAPVTIKLDAQPEESDPKGTSSRFVGKHEALGKKQEFKGTISGEVKGKPYTGEFDESKAEHDHDHDEKGHEKEKEKHKD